MRPESRKGHSHAAPPPARAGAFAALSLRDFEALIGDAFSAEGYEVLPEQGTYMEMRRGGRLFLVDCGQWRARTVPVASVRELYEEMTRRGVAGAFMLTAGSFTEDAQTFVTGTTIQLVDGRQLPAFVRHAGDER